MAVPGYFERIRFFIFLCRIPSVMKFNDNKMGSNLLLMIVQIVFCILVHDLAVSLYPKDRIVHRDIAWGLGLSNLFIYFSIVVFIQNVIDVIRSRSTITTNALEGLKVVDIIERIYAAGKK